MYRDRVSSDDRLAATWTLYSAIPSQSGETTPCFGYPLLYKSFAHPHCLQWLRIESRNTRNSLTLTPHSSLSLSLSHSIKRKKNLSLCPNSESHYYYMRHGCFLCKQCLYVVSLADNNNRWTRTRHYGLSSQARYHWRHSWSHPTTPSTTTATTSPD